jgi:RNA polymerase sigma factor (TIGR02999 family)
LARGPDGSGGSTPELFSLVYDQLKAMADRQMSRERPGLTLQATALVHEVYLRLSSQQDATWDNPRHFFAAAAEAMRRILVERARRYSRKKHGGGKRREELEGLEATPDLVDAEAMLTLDEAMDELRAMDPGLADVVMLRYFAGLSVEETATMMGRSERSVKYDWAAARAWLLRRIEGAE